MSDITGSRFLRMAGSDGFQRELNRSSQPTGTSGSSVSGDFSIQPVEGSENRSTTPEAQGSATGSFDYSILNEQNDSDKPSSLMGPGSFGKQVEREKYLNTQFPQQSSSDFVNKFAGLNENLQSGDANDGSSIAMKYIQNAAKTNPINIEALDKSIRQRPLYHDAA